jgi:hypothetical protein
MTAYPADDHDVAGWYEEAKSCAPPTVEQIAHDLDQRKAPTMPAPCCANCHTPIGWFGGDVQAWKHLWPAAAHTACFTARHPDGDQAA